MQIEDTLLRPDGSIAANTQVRIKALEQSGSIPFGAEVEHSSDSLGYVLFPLLEGYFAVDVLYDEANWYPLAKVRTDSASGTLTIQELINQYGVKQ